MVCPSSLFKSLVSSIILSTTILTSAAPIPLKKESAPALTERELVADAGERIAKRFPDDSSAELVPRRNVEPTAVVVVTNVGHGIIGKQANMIDVITTTVVEFIYPSRGKKCRHKCPSKCKHTSSCSKHKSSCTSPGSQSKCPGTTGSNSTVPDTSSPFNTTTPLTTGSNSTTPDATSPSSMPLPTDTSAGTPDSTSPAGTPTTLPSNATTIPLPIGSNSTMPDVTSSSSTAIPLPTDPSTATADTSTLPGGTSILSTPDPNATPDSSS